MPKSILAFASSARIGGNSDILCDRIIEGAETVGGETEKIHIHKLQIKPCLGCCVCLEDINAPCVIRDDMAPLLDKIWRADGFIFASPIYFCAVDGQMKIFLDRLNALFDKHDNTLSGKKAALAFTYAVKDPLKSGVFNALHMFQDAFAALNVQLVGWVHAACHEKGEILAKIDILKEAVLLGQQLNLNGEK